MTQQPTEGQDLPTNCWHHVHLSAHRGERSSSQFRGNARSARRVLQPEITAASSSYGYGTDPIFTSNFFLSFNFISQK